MMLHAVSSESSVGLLWIAKDANSLHVDNKDTGQTAQTDLSLR